MREGYCGREKRVTRITRIVRRRLPPRLGHATALRARDDATDFAGTLPHHCSASHRHGRHLPQVSARVPSTSEFIFRMSLHLWY